MITANKSAITTPVLPPNACPSHKNSAVRAARNTNVLTRFNMVFVDSIYGFILPAPDAKSSRGSVEYRVRTPSRQSVRVDCQVFLGCEPSLGKCRRIVSSETHWSRSHSDDWCKLGQTVHVDFRSND